jgi:hypothetical protein
MSSYTQTSKTNTSGQERTHSGRSHGGPSRRPTQRGTATTHHSKGGSHHQIIQFPKQNGGWQHSKIVFGSGHRCIDTLKKETGCNIVQPKWTDVKAEHKKMYPFFYIEGPTQVQVLDASVRVMKLLMTSMSRERFDLIKAADELEEIVQHQKLKIADMEQEQGPEEYRSTSPAYEPQSPPPLASSPPKEPVKLKPKPKLNLVVSADESEDEN